MPMISDTLHKEVISIGHFCFFMQSNLCATCQKQTQSAIKLRKAYGPAKVLEVHEKSDLVPALVHKKKFDCVPRSNHETCMKCFNWKFTKNMIEFPFPLMKYELVRELSFIDCVLPIP